MANKKPKSNAKASSDSSSESRNVLPFEPNKTRKQLEKKQAKQMPAVSEAARQKAEAILKPKSTEKKTATLTQSAIPEVVSRRMLRRMALFCGVPTLFGMSTFVVSYLVIANGLYDLPNSAVLLVSLGFFGLSVLGLSYGVLSTSWDEDKAGDWLGWSEFQTNFGRTVQAWRSGRSQ